MDSDQRFATRRLQLQKAIDRRWDGNQSQFARDAGADPSYVNRVLSGKSKENGGKRLGSELARTWEDEAGLPSFYFDTPDADPMGKPTSIEEELALLEDKMRALRERVGQIEPTNETPRESGDTGKWRLTHDVNSGKESRRRRKK